MISVCRQRESGFGRVGMILILPFIILIIVYGAYKLFFIPDPVISGLDAFDMLPAAKQVKLNTENVRSIDISIYQDGKEINVLKDAPETGEKVYAIEVRPQDLGLKDGRAIITVKAKAGILKKLQYDIESVVDTVPPALDVVRAPVMVNQGSGGVASIRASGEDAVFIKLVEKARPDMDKTFRAFKSEPITDTKDHSSGTSVYYAFFPVPFDVSEGSVYYAVATDAAGNQSVKTLPTRIKMKNFQSSTITIDDSFIHRVVLPLLNETSVPDPAEAFRKVNEEWRQESVNRLLDISQDTEPRMLWKGRFLQMRNSKVMATYGDKRTYIYKGKSISKSVHLGYDLASHAYAPVEAANAGIVRFADNLSIYGNAIVIDHGLGLMSLYGHLSTIAVKKGEEVSKGQIIAQSGSTGLAGGDHLHFGVLIQGYEVSPLYWWDSNWITTNVIDLLQK